MPELSNLVVNFIRTHQIDSIQKLHLLLFFQQCPNFEGNISDIAQKLCLADTRLVNRLILDLNKVGLMVETDCCWKLAAKPEVTVGLELLARSFERPLTRQKLLEQIKGGRPAAAHFDEIIDRTGEQIT